MANKAANLAQTRRLSDAPSVSTVQAVEMDPWVKVSQKRNLSLAAHPSPVQHQPRVFSGSEGLGEVRLSQGSCLALLPFTSADARNPDGTTVSLVPEEEAVALPGDKSLQSLCFP